MKVSSSILAVSSRLVCLLAVAGAGAPAVSAEEAEVRDRLPRMPAGVIELDETVISGNLLYLVARLHAIELRTDFAEVELFSRLYPPAYRRELTYYEAGAAAGENTDSNVSDSKE